MSTRCRRSRAQVSFALWALTALLGVSAGWQIASADPQGFQPFEFALLGDPQIGYGRGGEYGDAKRFKQVVAGVNARKAPLSIVAGDLVQDRTIWQKWIFGSVLEDMQGKVLLAPGNHDVVDEDSLEAYRVRHGQDYYDAVFNDCAFVIINSETARKPEISSREFAQQWAFIEKTLAAHRQAGRTHIVLVMHRPPFFERENEEADERNWPLDTRARLMSLVRRHGVRWILAGHLHRRAEVTTEDGVHILVGAGSARSFDRSPVGFDLFRVTQADLTHQLVVVAPPPAEGFSVPGLREWTPRIFAFSTRHWLFTIFYVLVGARALRTARRLGQRQDVAPRSSHAGWRAIALVLFALGANMQLDFDELIRESGRQFARLIGLYSIRHYITGTLTAVAVVAASVFLWRLYRRSRQTRAFTLALALLCVPGAWFGLSMISHHDLGMLISEDAWDGLITLSLVAIALCARAAVRNEEGGHGSAAQH